MLKHNSIYSEEAPAPVGPYSQAIKLGNLIFLSGQLPLDPLTGNLADRNIEAQTKQVLENIGAILKEVGISFSDVLKTTVFLTDMGNFGKVNEIYAEYFSSDPAPARSCIEVSKLPKDAIIEIELIAYTNTD